MKNTNTKGNVSIFRFEDNENYTMADLLYVNSQHQSIKRMYEFLQVFHQWSLNNVHKKNALQVVKDCKIDTNILRIMKKNNYLDDNFKWLFENQPSKADAVFLRIKLKKT